MYTNFECVCRHYIFSPELERVLQQCYVGDDVKETTNLEIESFIDTFQDDTLLDPVQNATAINPVRNYCKTALQ